jgi:hypothetical protein
MIREVNVKAHPNKLPTLLFELAQMLMEHSRVKPGIHAHQVPDVDCVLDRPHKPALASSSFLRGGHRLWAAPDHDDCDRSEQQHSPERG